MLPLFKRIIFPHSPVKIFHFLDIEKFEEGKFPRKLFFVKNIKI